MRLHYNMNNTRLDQITSDQTTFDQIIRNSTYELYHQLILLFELLYLSTLSLVLNGNPSESNFKQCSQIKENNLKLPMSNLLRNSSVDCEASLGILTSTECEQSFPASNKSPSLSADHSNSQEKRKQVKLTAFFEFFEHMLLLSIIMFCFCMVESNVMKQNMRF